jgi:putative endonuclease
MRRTSLCHAMRDNFLGNGVSKTIGSAFEQRALEYLQRQRLRFVARNFTCRGGEIDLVMREIGSQRALVFVEVRARRSRQFAAAAASIGAHKQRRLVLAARALSDDVARTVTRVPLRCNRVRRGQYRLATRCFSRRYVVKTALS